MDVVNELLDAIEIIVDKKIRENTAQIYPGICKSVSGSSCVMSINGKDNTIQFYGSIPTVGAIYRVFVPDGNMSMAFIITGGGGGGGGGGGESDVFYAIYGTTTNAEILAAYEAGKAVYMKKDGNNGVYPLIAIAGDSFAYFGCVIYSRNFKRYMCSADNWREDEAVLLAKEPVSTTVTLSASGWDSSAKTQTVTVSGVLADETKQLITPTPAIASQTAYYNAGIRCTGQSANSLTFTAKTIPTADLTVYVTIQGVGA